MKWCCVFSSFSSSHAGRHDSSLLFSSSSLSVCLFLCFLCFLFVSFIFSLSYYNECECRACRIQYDDMALHCLLCVLHTNDVLLSLAKFCGHRTCISLRRIEESERTLAVVVYVDRYVFFVFFLYPIHYLRTSSSLSPSNS